MLAVEGGVAPNVEIVIEKGIPVAGGMAGGSADAAAALVALNALWKLDFSRPDLDAFAARSGVTFRSRCTVALPSEPAAANNLSPC